MHILNVVVAEYSSCIVLVDAEKVSQAKLKAVNYTRQVSGECVSSSRCIFSLVILDTPDDFGEEGIYHVHLKEMVVRHFRVEITSADGVVEFFERNALYDDFPVIDSVTNVLGLGVTLKFCGELGAQ
jgi:hypothetical protein